ncbi:universal stress protein [Enterobacter sp. SLBN-59]|uniref:universal stress protein n=1 Tax=Enterobacter sp. SLBN-59 TaxID=2940621 RepID=UPI0038601CD7
MRHVASESLNESAVFHFLTVVSPRLQVDALGGVWHARSERSGFDEVKRKLKALADIFHLPEGKVHYHVAAGNPRQQIVAYANSLRADLVMISSHFPDISTYFLGSSALSVVRHTKCTVLVVR